MDNKRIDLIELAEETYSFLKNFPGAPTDIVWLWVWHWSLSRNEMKQDSVLSKYLDIWDFNHNLPKPIRDNLAKEVKSGKDCEKKVQALIKIYKD